MTALTRTRTTAVKLNEEGKAASGFEKIEISLAEAKLVICVGYFAGRSGMQPGWRAEATIGRDAAFSSLPPAIEGFTARSAAARAREPSIKQTFVRGAVLGRTLFAPDWVLDASRATKRRRVDTPSGYWVAALRNGLVESQGFPPFASMPEARSYISQLLNAVAGLADEVIAEYGDGDAELVSVAAEPPPLPAGAPDEETKRAWADKLKRRQEARQTNH